MSAGWSWVPSNFVCKPCTVSPAAGDTVQGLQTKFDGTQLHPADIDFRRHPGGLDGYVKKDVFRTVFAGDLPRSTTEVMWATQRPGDASTLQTASGAPAWQQIRS